MPATATPTLRDQLKAVKEALAEARESRATLVAERDSAKTAFAEKGLSATEMLASPEYRAAEKAVGALGEVDDKIADLSETEKGILAMLGESTPTPDRAGNGPTDAPAATGWNASRVIDGDAYKAFLAAGHPTSKGRFGAVNLGQLASREEATAFFATEVGSDNKQGAIPADRRGIIPPNLKRLTLLDLIPTGTTDSNSVEYVQVLTIPAGAAETAEGAAKPEVGFTTRDADAPVRTIAGWLKVRKQALSDVAGLRTLIGQLLPYDVRRRIESQLLVGDGVGQNLTGILNTDGIHNEIPAVDGDNTADAILRAITMIVLSDGDPNFVALNPLTWQDLLLMRENQAERTGAYLYGSPSMVAAPSIWGLAITSNRVVPEDEPLVGDANSASVLVREGVNVLVSDSDQDDFIKNRATVLAEARVAVPVWRPTSFAVAPVPTSGN